MIILDITKVLLLPYVITKYYLSILFLAVYVVSLLSIPMEPIPMNCYAAGKMQLPLGSQSIYIWLLLLCLRRVLM